MAMKRLGAGLALALLVGLAVWMALPSRVRPSTATAPAGDVAARVDACLVAQREVAQRRQARGGPTPPGQPSDAAVVSLACAPLYREAGCRDAMVRFDEPPMALRSSTVFKRCASAYCSLLPPPRPSACALDGAEPADPLGAWTELRQAILTRDVGADAAARVLGPAR